MRIEPNLRIFITGKTQSGKTYLAQRIIGDFKNRFIYDIKRQYSHLGEVCHELPEAYNTLRSGKSSIVYQPNDLSVEHFDDVCRFIFQSLRNLVFVVDEAHKFATKHKIPPYFNSLITICQGDPYFIGVIAITQRPANIHNDIISSSTIIISFKLTLRTDAEAVTGISADSIVNLKQYHYAVFDDREYDNPVSIHPPIGRK